MRSVVVVEALPHSQFLREIYVAALGEQLVELVLVRSMGALDFAVELRRSRLDVNVFHAQVSDVPVGSAWNSWPRSVRMLRIRNGNFSTT